MFHKESDLEAFERVMVDAHLRQPSRILLYCVLAFAMAGGTADELGGSCRRSFDHEGIRWSARQHRERTTIRRREVDAGNVKESRVGADRSSGRPPTENEPIGGGGDKLITRIPSSGQIDRQTNRLPVSLSRLRNRGRHPFHVSVTFGLGQSGRQTLATSSGFVSRLPFAVFRPLVGFWLRLGQC
jgi:hypothetical protein